MSDFMFNTQHAQQLVDTLKVIHGNLFTRQMGDVNPAQIETIIVGALFGITEQQFNFGLAQISSSRFCPTIAEFRAMCLSGSWWTTEEAWARACEYTKDRVKNKITTLTKYALDQVEQLITMGQMVEAKNQFKGVYTTNLLKAQSQGKSQQWHVPPKQIGLNDFASEALTTAQKHELTDDQKNIQVAVGQLMSQGFGFKDAFYRAQVQVTGKPRMSFYSHENSNQGNEA